jgi:hypothetical protein
MNRRLLIVAISLLAVAAALALLRGLGSNKPEAVPEPSRPVSNTDRLKAVPRSSAGQSSSLDRRRMRPPAERSSGRERSDHAADAGAARDLQNGALANSLPNYPTRLELERRAAKVEQEANHELRRLIPLLDLKPEQEDRVFQAVARSSPSFVPGMMIGGTAAATATSTAEQTVAAELTDAQVAAYLQDSDERKAWWSEYLSTVSSQLATGTPDVGGGSATVAAAAAAPPPGDSQGDTTTPATKDAHPISDGE